MDDAQAQELEDLVIALIEAIYRSELIPNSHKESYVEYIKKNGVTEKMVEELSKVFSQESEQINLDLEEKKELLSGLEAIVAEELDKNDETQAEIVAAVENYGQRKVDEAKQNLEGLETEMNDAVEGLGKKLEEDQMDAIRAKLAEK